MLKNIKGKLLDSKPTASGAPPRKPSTTPPAAGVAKTATGSGKPEPAARNVFPLEQLPNFKDTPAGERQALFIKKLKLCSNPMDYKDDDKAKEKEIKRFNLLEIMDYINTTKGVFNEGTFEEITNMISANLFRGLAPNKSPPHLADPDEDEPVLEASWPHLQYVYEFLLRFVVSNETDPKIVKKYISQDFLVRLLDLFDSEDPRERDYLKTILHRIYGKFMPYRAFIRKAINSIFYRFIYETERHNGIAELLEILGSIINGFALPLKDEHKSFLTKALLPLHKLKNVSMYHQQLSYCVTQFVEKDNKLAESVLNAILRFWPTTCSKEVLFLNEVEEILEMLQETDLLDKVAPKLFVRIAQCVGSPHFQVAERALFLWNNEYIVGLIAAHRTQILPIVYGALFTNSQKHWNSTVHGLTCNVVKLFMEMDHLLFDKCSQEWIEKKKADEIRIKVGEETLEKIKIVAKTQPLYPKVRLSLETDHNSSLAYIMRKRLTEASGTDEVQLDKLAAQGFQSCSGTPSSDALKRKSLLAK